MNAFSSSYVPVINWGSNEQQRSQAASKRREEGMQSDDLAVRINARGFIPGMKSDNTKTDRIKRSNSKV